jgi:hypothetical protein
MAVADGGMAGVMSSASTGEQIVGMPTVVLAVVGPAVVGAGEVAAIDIAERQRGCRCAPVLQRPQLARAAR